MSATISLVITVYNRERYLAAAIESVLTQTRSDFELLIWDDGSTDGSVSIARHYRHLDRRVLVVAAKSQGRGQALHDALATVKGKYIGWVDSDDLLINTALADTGAVLDSQPEVGMVYSDYLVIDENGKVQGLGKRCQIPYSPQKLLVEFMTFHFRLMRREVYQLAGGIDPKFGTIEDYELCLRLSEVTTVQQIKKPLYLYRVHRESICQTQQIEQIKLTQMAIEQALVRRGLADQLELEVLLRPKFVLHKRERD